jgi:hypothetical protein
VQTSKHSRAFSGCCIIASITFFGPAGCVAALPQSRQLAAVATKEHAGCARRKREERQNAVPFSVVVEWRSMRASQGTFLRQPLDKKHLPRLAQAPAAYQAPRPPQRPHKGSHPSHPAVRGRGTHNSSRAVRSRGIPLYRKSYSGHPLGERSFPAHEAPGLRVLLLVALEVLLLP